MSYLDIRKIITPKKTILKKKLIVKLLKLQRNQISIVHPLMFYLQSNLVKVFKLHNIKLKQLPA